MVENVSDVLKHVFDMLFTLFALLEADHIVLEYYSP